MNKIFSKKDAKKNAEVKLFTLFTEEPNKKRKLIPKITLEIKNLKKKEKKKELFAGSKIVSTKILTERSRNSKNEKFCKKH